MVNRPYALGTGRNGTRPPNAAIKVNITTRRVLPSASLWRV